MRYLVPIFVRRHDDGRVTIEVLDGGAGCLVAHAETREAAEAALREALVARLEDPDDGLAERLLLPTARELRRARVPVRLRRRSGRRAEVTVPITYVVVRPPEGPPEIAIPRLRAWFAANEAQEGRDDIEAAVEDEVRGALSGADDAEALACALDADESLEGIEVEARPRARARSRSTRAEEERGALAEVGEDLVREAKRGAVTGAFGREQEVAALMDAIASSPAVSVVLAGAPGVGKTAIVHEVARRIATGGAPAALRDARLVYVPGSRIIAGMSYLGDWEERAKAVVDEARARRAVLFVGDLAELCDAGRADERDAGVARFLAPHVARGEIVVLAESTLERLRRVERIDPALLPLFRILLVHELPREATLDVLRRAAGPIARRHGAELAPGAIEAAVELGARFVPGRAFPGKAVGLLERAARAGGALDRARVVETFARESGIPEAVLRDDVPLDRDALVRDLEARVVEQPEAARALADAVVLLKAGLNDPRKPVAVLLFAGPPGVGKTESARALAERLFGDARRLVRFDMSEYGDPEAHRRLVGTEEGAEGELCRKVREQPFSVLLLDEIEKAHEVVMDMLLSVLGDGRLVDHGGRVADFRSAVIVLTTNLGSGSGEALGLGGAPAGDRFRAAAEAFFRPELLNRIDRIVPFGPLSPAAIERIARRELDAIVAREGLERRGVAVRFAPELVTALARAGYRPGQGARPLRREIERRVLDSLARHLARRGGRAVAEIEVSLDGDEVRIAARDVAPRRTVPADRFTPPANPTPGALREGVSLVRVRLLDARESWPMRERATDPRVAEIDREIGGMLAEVAAIEAEIDRPGADLGPLAEKLAALDERADAADRALRERG